MPNHNFSFFAHPGHDVPKLPVSVRRLIEVHEIHINTLPWNGRIELRMQMAKRFLQLLQTPYPHFCRREGVHPGDDANASLIVIRGQAKLLNTIGRSDDLLLNQVYGDRIRRVQSLNNTSSIRSYLLQCFRAVQMLATGYKPNYFTFHFAHSFSVILLPVVGIGAMFALIMFPNK